MSIQLFHNFKWCSQTVIFCFLHKYSLVEGVCAQRRCLNKTGQRYALLHCIYTSLKSYCTFESTLFFGVILNERVKNIKGFHFWMGMPWALIQSTNKTSLSLAFGQTTKINVSTCLNYLESNGIFLLPSPLPKRPPVDTITMGHFVLSVQIQSVVFFNHCTWNNAKIC